MHDKPLQIATSPTEKAIAALTGFGFACFAFFLIAIVVVPLTGKLAAALGMAEWITASLVFFELFGLTAIAGIAGVVQAAKGIAKSKL